MSALPAEDRRDAVGSRPGSRTGALRALLESPELGFLVGVHNGLSARIAQEAGFPGLWASGLGISAQFGVRDSNEASWTQVVETLEFMVDATDIPILLDGDTGYGNFNNFRRLVRKLEQRGIAGVCIEDKEFPKTNSLLNGGRQPLADLDLFCGKIRAGVDSRNDRDFCIVARVEALIAGWGLDEALRRAEAYHESGADAILIHSKRRGPEEILDFAREWDRRCPLVIVPTTYYSTPVDVFRQAGVSVAIWANQLVRASVAAMKEAARAIATTGSPVAVEDQIASVEEIFRLQGAAELLEAERIYAGSTAEAPAAVVLAAARGEGLEAVTEDRPKVMLPVAGKPLLHRLVEGLNSQAVERITVVAGYRAETIDLSGVEVVENPRYAETGELVSLACVEDVLMDDTLLLYGDLLFRKYILRDLLDVPGDVVTVVDSAHRRNGDTALCTAADDRSLFRQDVELVRIGNRAPRTSGPADARAAAAEGLAHGRWVGIVRLRGEGLRRAREALEALRASDDFDRLGVPDLLNRMVEEGCPVKVFYINGHWLDVNDLEDLRRAADFAHGRSTS